MTESGKVYRWTDFPQVDLFENTRKRSAFRSDGAMVVFNWTKVDMPRLPGDAHPFDQTVITFKGRQMMFHRGGKTNAPLKSYGIWAMAQYQRLGLSKTAPAYTKIADEIVLTDAYEKAASEFGIDVPEDMQPIEIALDKVTFDPKKPGEEATRT